MTHPTRPIAKSQRPRSAWVTGAGSGIGRAVAEELGRRGYAVALSGRRRPALDEVATVITQAGGRAVAVHADVSDGADVTRAHTEIVDAIGPLDTLVCCAGTNVVDRWWSNLTADNFDKVVNTNLNAVTRTALEVLPGFRAAGFGQIVVVSSFAGWRFMSVAGAAYGASKAALGPLVESLNDQEGRHGIRATHFCPGEVNTEILQTRPVPPSPEELALMLQPPQLAEIMGSIVDLPTGVCVNEMVVTPTHNRIYLASSAAPSPRNED